MESHDRAPTRRLAAWMLLTTLVPATALAGLGWALVRADRAREAESRRAIREHAATVGATALQRTVAELEEQLSSLSLGHTTSPGSQHDGVAVVSFNRSGAGARTGWQLPFYPVRHTGSSAAAAVLERADMLEFRARDEAAAIALLQPLATTSDAGMRGEALLRLGRLQRKRGQVAAALDAFERLSALDDVLVQGEPAGLVAAQGRALALAAAGRRDEVTRVAAGLLRDLDQGRWWLGRAEYLFAREQASGWLGASATSADAASLPGESIAVATALEAVWTAWRQGDASVESARGRFTRWAKDRSVLAITRNTNDQLTVMLVGPRELERRWRAALPTPGVPGIRLALSDADGHPVLGDSRASPDRQAVRTVSATTLPWTVHAIEGGAAPAPTLSRQAALMLAALGVMMLAVAAGGYATTRSIAREIRVSRLQSEFVSAVSHEFRTPLTAVRHLSQLLARGRVSSDDRRAEFYDLLVRESDRLHRLVESLLNFARLEAGELRYRFEPIDPGAYLRALVSDFTHDVGRQDVRITLVGDEEPLPAIRADREVLARVFWNLLDNAVKYSSGAPGVCVEVEVMDEHLRVHVRDGGMGVPAAEQPHVFQKFVRGAAARAGSIKGTGIGLAMAREIVRAHGGDITLVSAVGVGSTFTVHLPVALEETVQR